MRWYVSNLAWHWHSSLTNFDTQFEMHVPARKFSSYKCVGRSALQAIKEKDSDAVVQKDTKEQQVYAEEVEHTA
jgi:MFS transporter, SP family, sugar:H+ symporter